MFMSISDWSDMFTDTITLAELTSRDSYGKPNYGSAASFDARVTFKDELTRDSKGREVLSKGHVWIEGTPTITPEYELTLSDSTVPPILTTETYQDENGTHHVKVFFG